MANSRRSGQYYEYATVDTDIASEDVGYFTNAISPRNIIKEQKAKQIFFSIRETDAESAPSVITVGLQFKCYGDAFWQDYNETFSIGDRKVIEESAGYVEWRAGVKAGDVTSGSVTFGFDW
jgi:hypothetical protein